MEWEASLIEWMQAHIGNLEGRHYTLRWRWK